MTSCSAAAALRRRTRRRRSTVVKSANAKALAAKVGGAHGDRCVPRAAAFAGARGRRPALAGCTGAARRGAFRKKGPPEKIRQPENAFAPSPCCCRSTCARRKASATAVRGARRTRSSSAWCARAATGRACLRRLRCSRRARGAPGTSTRRRSRCWWTRTTSRSPTTTRRSRARAAWCVRAPAVGVRAPRLGPRLRTALRAAARASARAGELPVPAGGACHALRGRRRGAAARRQTEPFRRFALTRPPSPALQATAEAGWALGSDHDAHAKTRGEVRQKLPPLPWSAHARRLGEC